MSRYDIEQLLDRYVKGETSAAETELVENWLAKNEPASTEWQRLNKQDRAQWLNGVFNDIQTNTIKPALVIKLWPAIATVAAALAIFVTVLWFKAQPGRDQQLATLAVPAQQKHKLTLADGSVVWINSGTELKYPKAFNGVTREVYLTGEAYFDIRHDAAKPFIVHTGKVVTAVLGTAFNINARKNSNTIVVTVTRGKVSVADRDRLLGYITPNQQLTYNLSAQIETKTTVDANKVIDWQSELYFDDITFEEAANLLQNRFDVKITFNNVQVKNSRFSGTALQGDNLDHILKVICTLNHAAYTRNPDGTITIN